MKIRFRKRLGETNAILPGDNGDLALSIGKALVSAMNCHEWADDVPQMNLLEGNNENITGVIDSLHQYAVVDIE